MVALRDIYGYDKGDTMVTKTGERLPIASIELKGSEGALAYVFVTAPDGRCFESANIDHYEKISM